MINGLAIGDGGFLRHFYDCKEMRCTMRHICYGVFENMSIFTFMFLIKDIQG
jgi:hypothetical protein